MLKRLGLVFACLVLVLVSLPSAAAEAVTGYSQCVALVQKNPALAEESARAWQDIGGGAAAVHCSALALTALELMGDAATMNTVRDDFEATADLSKLALARVSEKPPHHDHAHGGCGCA